MENVLIISDFFREDYQGGAEMALDALISLIRNDCKLTTKKSLEVTPEFIRDFDGKIILSNRMGLSTACYIELYKKNYCLWEHDFFYLNSRDAGSYQDLKAPPEDIKESAIELYKNAKFVFLQGVAHLHAYKTNLDFNNGISTSGNPWSESDLKLLESLQSIEKTGNYCVLNHQFSTKGTKKAIKFCNDNSWPYNVIPNMPHKEFLSELAKFKILVFIPDIFETYSRVCCEARCLNLDILVNPKVGFQYEQHSRLKGLELISYLRDNNKKIKSLFLYD